MSFLKIINTNIALVKNTLFVVGNKLQKVIDYKETLKRYEDIEINATGEIKDVYRHFSINVDGNVEVEEIFIKDQLNIIK